jgi:RecA/RadA recombinase
MKCSRNNRDIVNISVNDYLKQPNNFKHHHGLYYSPTISFEKQDKPLPLDPYIFGLWLGDGTSAGPSLTTADKEIADKWTEFGESIGLQCNVYGASNPRNAKSRRLHLTKGERRTNNFSNPLSSVLRELGVLNNKHIPQIYLTSSVEERRALLAGLIDTDGDGSFTKEVTHTSITTKWKHLAEQIEFLAKSLGLYSEINERWSRHEKTAEPKKYWRVSIGGALHEIPTILPHKKFKQKDYELTRLERVTTFSVEEIGEDDFYGFSVNEDHLYVMDGFFVTHNSGKSTFALVLMAKEQERFPDKYAIWIDTEYSFDAARAASLGVDLDRVILFQSNLMEDAIAPLGKMEQEIVKDQSICFIGLDAVKGLTSINEQEQISEGNVESAASAYGGIAKSVNPALNLLVRLSYETKCVTILCNHAMANLDPKTSKYYPYILTGGQKLKHLCSTVIFLNKPARKDALLSSDLKDSSGNAIAVGSTIVAKVNKSEK